MTRLFAGKQRLLLSPHKVLHQLPLQALAWQGEPLCAHFAVTIVPNLTSLLLGAVPPARQFSPLVSPSRQVTTTLICW